MSDLAVRAARPEEYAEIAEVRVRAYVDSGLVDADDRYTDQLRRIEPADGAELLVAVDADDTILGTVVLACPPSPAAQIASDGELEFRMLATAPRARGRGVGELLVNAVSDRARELGLTRVVISVVEGNDRAIRLYRRLGFHRLPERDWSPVPDVLLHVFAFAFAVA